jgi:hypothetical protein
MKKLVILAMFAISFLATTATVMAGDNPFPDCSTGQCDWLR